MQIRTLSRIGTRTVSRPTPLMLALLGALGFSAPVRAAEPLATPDLAPATAPAPAESIPSKQWVWLWRQGLWGFGYQRGDGLWVIDPGTKVAPAPPAAPAATAPAASSADPYGFVHWLNATRASFGLAPVGVDPNLSSWAQANNAQQQARGLGHHVMGPARRQNSAMGGYGSIHSMWMNSPAHRAALLDPTIRSIGIAGLGAYWTFNAN